MGILINNNALQAAALAANTDKDNARRYPHGVLVQVRRDGARYKVRITGCNPGMLITTESAGVEPMGDVPDCDVFVPLDVVLIYKSVKIPQVDLSKAATGDWQLGGMVFPDRGECFPDVSSLNIGGNMRADTGAFFVWRDLETLEKAVSRISGERANKRAAYILYGDSYSSPHYFTTERNTIKMGVICMPVRRLGTPETKTVSASDFMTPRL